MREHPVDEALETLWVLREQKGVDAEGRFARDEAERIFKALGNLEGEDPEAMLKTLAEEKLILPDGDLFTLTPEGEARARSITRRHRLAERLLSDVFAMSDNEVESSACRFEHILGPEVEESICAFLGHPPICPHGRQIPPGPCCGKFSSEVRALVTPLRELRAGDSAKIVFISTRDRTRLEKLGLFGIMPDGVVVLRRKSPSFIVQCGETEVALDTEIANEIFVKKML